jgi:hypothetical protein
MAELLVQLQTHPGITPDVNTVAGDVVVVMPDGWGWGTSERNSPFFGIWRIPGAPVADYDHLINPVYGTPDSMGATPRLLQRGEGFDLGYGPLEEFIDGRLEVVFDTPESLEIMAAAFRFKPVPAQIPDYVTLG